jgi:hypothetical protein
LSYAPLTTYATYEPAFSLNVSLVAGSALADETSTRPIAFVISSVDTIVYRSKTDHVFWPLIAIAVFPARQRAPGLASRNVADHEQSAQNTCTK